MEVLGILVCVLAARAIFGGITAAIANHKGRSVVGWFFAGFFIDVIAIIIVAVLPNLKEQSARDRWVEEENRRLREQLRQERIKGESFRVHATRRLDVHDQQMGIDSRAPLALEADGKAPPGLPAGSQIELEGDDGGSGAVVWYYEFQGKTQGPVNVQAIRRLLQVGQITGDNLVWSPDLTNWTPLRQVTEFSNDVLPS